MANRLLITGATGLVGRSLLQSFAQLPIRVALRRCDPDLSKNWDCKLVGNIDQNTDWTDAIEDVECVIHMAAHVHVMNATAHDEQQFLQTNIAGTERLAHAAVRAGVRRFVFLSSIKVNGDVSGDKSFTATDEAYPVDEYGLSKYEAEKRLFDIAATSEMKVVVIRPPLVYGPGVKANFLRLMSWIYTGVPLPFGRVENRRSMISVWNLCDLIKCVVESPSIGAGILMASDGEDLSTPDLIRRLASCLGRPLRLFPVPIKLLTATGLVTGKSREIARLCGSLTVDISETKRRLNWTPPFSVNGGLAQTARWYLDEVRVRRA